MQKTDTSKEVGIGIQMENLARRKILKKKKILKGRRGKKDGLVQGKINWFMSLGSSQVTQVEQARQPKRKQVDKVDNSNTITKHQKKK